MKFSLFFLACCFVATTVGQNLFYWPYAPYGGSQYQAAVPSSRSSGRYWPRYYQKYVSQPESSFEDYFGEDNGDDEEIYGRSKYQIRAGGSNRRPFNKFNQKFKAEDRLLFPSSKTVTPVVSVVTVFSTTTTITSTSFSSCIPSAQFNIDKTGGKLSTAACRRKRDSQQVMELIAPTSNIDQIETTQVAEEKDVFSRLRRDIESSEDEVMPRFGFNLLNNALPGLSLLFPGNAVPTITTTFTIPTSFASTTTTVAKTLTLLNPAPQADAAGKVVAGVNCLPAGVGVC